MKDTKRTPVPLPGSKKKSKAKDTPSKAPLSQEFIDSDDDASNENTPQAKPVAKPKVNGATKAKSKSSNKESGAPVSASTKTAPKKPAPKQIATQEQAEELSSSERTDDSDAPARDIQTKLSGNTQDEDASSDSTNEASSDDSSDEAGINHNSPPSRTPAQSQSQPQPQVHAVAFQPQRPYEPPRGFNPVPLNDKTMSHAAGLFGNLQGKQIWHITAPASVSLKDLKELSMQQAIAGETVLKHKGADYGFSKTEKSEDGTREVLVPQKDGYRAVSARISQTLHLRALVQLPELSLRQADQNTGSEAAASITRSTIRAPRPQVTGLKMRFLPTGFGGNDAGTLGDSDEENDVPQETAVLGMRDGLNLPSRKEKRKYGDVNGAGASDAPSKKSKKERSAEEVKRKEERRAKKAKKGGQEA